MTKQEIDKLIDDMTENYSINFIHSSTRAQTDGISHRELTRMLVEFADDLLDKISSGPAHAGRGGGFANVFEDNPDAGKRK